MFFARVVRRIQRTHSVVYPCIQYQQLNTNTRRERLFGSHFSQSTTSETFSQSKPSENLPSETNPTQTLFYSGVQTFPVKSFTVQHQEKNLDFEKPIFDPTILNNSSQNGYSAIPESSSGVNSFTLPFDRGYIANGSGISNNTPNPSASPYTDSGVLVYKPTPFGSNSSPHATSFQAAQSRLEIDLLPDRDWNQEFNEVLESPPLQRAEKLRNLENEFIAVASKIGKLIITERNLPLSQRQISPKPMSGLAGGEKFQVKGIFFKFAVDKHQLYGSDENAMKVACHELKAHTALVSCGMMHGLKLGLMTVIDYQGCRLTATSVLPIDDSTLVYGSSDGGNLVVASLDVMNDVMSKCSRVLNLKGHVAGIGVNTKFIYGPCDLEGHLGHDGRLYAIDLARLFPPETPNSSIPGGFLYRLLRPELVRTFPKPLSSDAFTLFGKHDSDTHDSEVRQATEFLHHHVIPEFAKSLNLTPPNSSIAIEELLEKLHRSGINIRFLGEVRMHLAHLGLRRTILTEICARVLKNELRRRLRELSAPTDANCAKLCATFFNTVFHVEGKMSRLYWHALKPKIIQRFSHALTDTEMRPEYDLRKHVQFDLLFARLQENLGVQISVELNQLPLNSEHVSKFIVKVKPMYTIPRIEADTAAELARSCKDIQETKRLLALARSKYCTILELKPDDSVVLSSK
jgi:hypothetical protein